MGLRLNTNPASLLLCWMDLLCWALLESYLPGKDVRVCLRICQNYMKVKCIVCNVVRVNYERMKVACTVSLAKTEH